MVWLQVVLPGLCICNEVFCIQGTSSPPALGVVCPGSLGIGVEAR